MAESKLMDFTHELSREDLSKGNRPLPVTNIHSHKGSRSLEEKRKKKRRRLVGW